PEPTPTPAPVDFTMMFVGDLMCLSSQQRYALSQSDGSVQYEFRPSFQYVRSILEKADCAIGNLETALSSNWPYATELRETPEDGMPNCNGPAQYLLGVKYAGFDALVMANNHCCDAGKQGIIDTIDAVESYGFPHTGVFKSADEKRYIILDIKGVKVALLSYAEFYNGKQGCVSGSEYMINTYSEEVCRRDVAAAKADGAELIVAYNHWGAEHTHKPTDKVRRHAQEMANAGVDLIIGSHSHSMQPIVWLTAEGGRKVYCCYSLGNFVSSMSPDTAKDTVIVELALHRGSDGSVSVTDETCHTCRVFPNINEKWWVVIPTNVQTIPSIISTLQAADKRIMDIIMSER
ncbi:MAG: CapA family protein, partial [Clostridia bacterium]|nr:CapA family protein [Clostridia bacterium]